MAGETRSDVPQRVLEAAKQVFFARGFHNSSLRAIAKRAGTSESGVLRFYQGKIHLLQCVYAYCWSTINERLDAALSAATTQDPDPRYRLLAVMRAALEDYEASEPMMHFMLTTFGFQETVGYGADEDTATTADEEARREYRRYLARIYGLCDEVVSAHPAFAHAGVSGDALAQLSVAVINGVQGGWYASRLEPGLDRPKLTIDQALAAMKLLLYRD
jgi:AcrR family transcriptional regulator